MSRKKGRLRVYSVAYADIDVVYRYIFFQCCEHLILSVLNSRVPVQAGSKAIAPNLFTIQCSVRFSEIDREIWHACSMSPYPPGDGMLYPCYMMLLRSDGSDDVRMDL